eukprot:m.226806 g.226806  ORF g.226806 m.226806 type:complete len:86 (-) comp18805_c0_seq8:1026-1283(-)
MLLGLPFATVAQWSLMTSSGPKRGDHWLGEYCRSCSAWAIVVRGAFVFLRLVCFCSHTMLLTKARQSVASLAALAAIGESVAGRR